MLLASWISKAGGILRSGAVEKKSLVSGVSSPEQWFLDLLNAQPVAAGVSVTPETAMRCSAVRCAVESIAETVGQLPIFVYRRGADGSKERAPQHPVYRLVHDEVSDWLSAGAFRESLTRDALLHGAGLAFIARNSAGTPIELQRLNPSSVTIQADDFGAPHYFVNVDRGRIELDRGNVLHLAAPGNTSPVMAAREAIGVLLAIEAYVGRLFANGARPSLAVLMNDDPGEGSLEKIIASWKATHGGAKQGGTAILQGVADIKQLTMSSVDAQLIEIWSRLILDIARALRVPPVILQDYSRQTWANSEFGGQQFLTYTLERWLKAWEGEIRLKLFSPPERDTLFAEFMTDDLLRSDFAARAESYSKLVSARIYTPNEIRAMENRPPIAGGDVLMNPNTTSSAPLQLQAKP